MHTTGGLLTAGSLKNAFLNSGVHPLVVEKLHGSGFFSNLFDAVKKGTKFVLDNQDTIAKVGKAGFDAYKASKKGSGLTAGTLKSKSQSKRKQTPWTKLVTKITKQQKCGVAEAIQYIKENELY